MQMSDSELAVVIYKFHKNTGSMLSDYASLTFAKSVLSKYYIFITNLLVHEMQCESIINPEHLDTLIFLDRYLYQQLHGDQALVHAIAEEIKLNQLDDLL